jgi:hypothetical protein
MSKERVSSMVMVHLGMLTKAMLLVITPCEAEFQLAVIGSRMSHGLAQNASRAQAMY